MTDLAPLHLISILAIAAIAVLTIAAVIDTFRDSSITLAAKLGWTLLLILIPGFGLLAWTIVRLARRRSVRYARRLSADES